MHDGKCHERKNNCLYFEKDERGTLEYRDFNFTMHFEDDIKLLKKGQVIEVMASSNKAIVADNAKIRVRDIKEVTWCYGKHGINGVDITINASYYSEEIKVTENKRDLFKIVK